MASNEAIPVNVLSHNLIVPRHYIVSGNIPWQPASEHEGFMFYRNPDAALEDQDIVLIDPKLSHCRNLKELGESPMGQMCRYAVSGQIADYKNPIRVNEDGLMNFWGYLASDTNLSLASCYSSVGSGSCVSFGVYGDIVYQLSFQNDNVDNLDDMHLQVRNLLTSWESAELRI